MFRELGSYNKTGKFRTQHDESFIPASLTEKKMFDWESETRLASFGIHEYLIEDIPLKPLLQSQQYRSEGALNWAPPGGRETPVSQPAKYVSSLHSSVGRV